MIHISSVTHLNSGISLLMQKIQADLESLARCLQKDLFLEDV